MKINSDNQILGFPALLMNQLSQSKLELTDSGVKGWWDILFEAEKHTLCQIIDKEVLFDLSTVANDAVLLIGKSSFSYKKRDIVSWRKSKDEAYNINLSTFEFNLAGKDLIENHLAELFSCFQLTIVKKPLSASNSGSESPMKSYLGIKKEKLSSVFSMLLNSRTRFILFKDEATRLVMQEGSLMSKYSNLINYFSQNLYSIQSLPPYLKKLLERLAACALIIEQNIISAYEDSKAPKAEVQEANGLAIVQNISDQLSNLTSLLKMSNNEEHIPAPLIVKTVSQLEREVTSEIEKLQIDQTSTASDSPGVLVLPETKEDLNIQELTKRLSPHTFNEEGEANSVTGEPLSANSVKKSKAENAEKVSKSVGVSPEKNNEDYGYYNNNAMEIYSGIVMGDLMINFRPIDMELMEEDEALRSSKPGQSQGSQSVKDFEELQSEENQEADELNQSANNGNYAVEGQQYDQNGYYMMYNQTQMMMGNPYANMGNYSYQSQQYYGYQYNNGQDMMAYGYDQSVQNPYASENAGYQQMEYGYYNNNNVNNYEEGKERKPSWESQSSLGSDRDYYNSYSNNNQYYSGYKSNNYNSDKSYYYKDKSKFESSRPNLPPRFQKKRERLLEAKEQIFELKGR